jgi:hypothetical protein
LQYNFFLTSFVRALQDTSMKATKVYSVKVEIKKVAAIEDVMNALDKTRTGLARLTAAELRVLNQWMDANTVLAPGNKPGNPTPMFG